MATVETVTGAVDASELGTTLIHEHLLARDEAVHAQWPGAVTLGGDPPVAIEPGGEYEQAVEAARSALELGVRTVCDPTAMFLGRDAAFMRRVAEETGLQVVACTGIYTYDHLPTFFLSRDPDQIADLFVADIETGIQGTGAKAAFIKCAADEPGVTENVEKVHRAAAVSDEQIETMLVANPVSWLS
jgi:phosphotriesterase-related protein